MYEHRMMSPLTFPKFLRRMALHGSVALALIAVSLFVGMFGFHHYLANKSWSFSFLNASMILSGMGPVEAEKLGPTGQVFAGVYALYSGIVFIVVMGIVLAPVIHRILHRFHWEAGR